MPPFYHSAAIPLPSRETTAVTVLRHEMWHPDDGFSWDSLMDCANASKETVALVVFGLLILTAPACLSVRRISVYPRRMLSFGLALIPAAVLTLRPVEANAQPRGGYHGHGGSHVSVGVGVGFGYGHPVYAAPYFYNPYWWGFYGGFYGGFWGYPYFAAPYPYYGYPGYGYPGYGFYDASADLRLQVTQRAAEVYVDGYLVGTVDDFDGVFQRVHMPLGEHEVTIYSPGFRSITQRMLFRPWESYKIKDTLQPRPAGEPDDPRPTPAPRPSREEAPPPPGNQRMEGPPQQRGNRLQVEPGNGFGAVAVRVQPADAEVLVDGERWEGTAGERIVVQLTPGTHRVEVRKPGFRPYSTTVDIRSGQTFTVNVSLSSQ